MNNEIKEILSIKDLRKKYTKIIDYISKKIEQDMQGHNYCDFKDGKCVANRLGKSVHDDNGCCYIYKEGLCKYLGKKGCTINCLSCKLFMCAYIEKKYKKVKLKKIFPINKVFNRKQILVLIKSFFKDKEQIIDLLIEKSR